MSLEFINYDQVRINSREFTLDVFDPPTKDGNNRLLEATSNLTNKYQEKLSVSELEGTFGSMLPKGLQIIFYWPEARNKGLDFLAIENLVHNRRITISIKYDFQDWTYRTNLIHFGEEYRSLIEKNVKNIQDSSVEKDEYGISIWCSVFLEETDDCFDVYSLTDKTIFCLYKQAIENSDKNFIKKLEAPNPSHESGVRWWVRYVLVPIISGGVGAAFIAWLLRNL